MEIHNKSFKKYIALNIKYIKIANTFLNYKTFLYSSIAKAQVLCRIFYLARLALR